jgi:hypothetical protein
MNLERHGKTGSGEEKSIYGFSGSLQITDRQEMTKRSHPRLPKAGDAIFPIYLYL